MKFKHSVIGYNTAENREWLEKLGYKNMHPSDPDNFRYDTIAACKDGVYFLTNEISDTVNNIYVLEEYGYINCTDNHDLFKAVSAMRNNSDYMQWFTDSECFELCLNEKFEQHLRDKDFFHTIPINDCYKATIAELQEHFKKLVMKEFKGTKGEWEKAGSAVVVNGVQIADVYCYGDLEDNKHEAVANAQLMASAPKLLEALKGLLTITNDSEGPHGYHLNGDLAFWEEFPEVEFAEIVLKKALGE